MGCSEIKYMTLPHANEAAASNDHLLVVGGGIVGMTAAIEAAAAGYPVTLVEKSGQLGGSRQLRIQAHSRAHALCRSGRHRRGGDGGEDRGQQQDHRAPQLDAHQDQRCPGPFLGGHLHRVRLHHHGKLRRHHHGLGRTQLRCEPAAGTRLRQEPGRGRPGRPGEAGAGSQRRPDQAPVRRQGSAERGVRAVRRPAFHEGRPPALLFRPLLPDLDQAGHVLQGPEPADRHQHHLLRPAHPGCRRRGLLPQRPAEGHHLHQGHGQRSRRQRRQRKGEVQGPDPGPGSERERRPGGAGHRHGAELRRQHRSAGHGGRRRDRPG